ncbi:hypothetical protein Lal_00037402 [Lupinus albus]|nr:hypothetical protein Lal_00037402 [Lupinus albus]
MAIKLAFVLGWRVFWLECDSALVVDIFNGLSIGGIQLHISCLMIVYQSRKPRLIERFSPERERITWEGEILDYTGGFSPERELSRLGEKWQFWAVDTAGYTYNRNGNRAFRGLKMPNPASIIIYQHYSESVHWLGQDI